LQNINAIFSNKSVFVSPETMSITEILQKLIEEGQEVTACIPQTDLKALFGGGKI